MKTVSILKLVRPNILKLKPYEAARHLMNEPAILLDANENPFESELNRYPDPWQRKLKERIAQIKAVDPKKIFIGNGSDEIIDLLLRIFCEPGKDKIITTPPTYGMYEVSAAVNDIQIKEVLLEDDFSIDPEKVLQAADTHTKLVFLCSPNNPSGNSIPVKSIEKILNGFSGVVVIDEAYADFASTRSLLDKMENHQNLVIMQTLSKAYGLAGLRLGLAFANMEIMQLLNKVKPPYNVSVLNQEKALDALQNKEVVQEQVKLIKAERTRLVAALKALPFVRKVHPSEANFLLTEMEDPKAVFQYLKECGIIVRDRSNVIKCEGCLRITVGTPEENKLLIQKLKSYEKN